MRVLRHSDVAPSVHIAVPWPWPWLEVTLSTAANKQSPPVALKRLHVCLAQFALERSPG